MMGILSSDVFYRLIDIRLTYCYYAQGGKKVADWSKLMGFAPMGGRR
jgi:hypothetical protein